ncbi:MAG: LysM peptidoglycan-binding domain-containing protein [Rhodobacteraceae bacterium]|nr:LysM peptidoglycan-binding domain-containing protein [Paracoccaceae bacterium]
MDREPGGGKGMARATDNSRPGWLAEGVLIGVIVVSVGAANLPVSGQLVVPAPSDTGEARGQQAGAESQPADVQVAATGQPLAAPEAADPTTTPAADAEPASEPEATDQVVASQTAAEREGPASPDSPDGNEVAVPEPETAPTSPPTPTTITTAEPSGAGVVSSETGPETETTTDSVTDTATDTAIKIAAPSADEPVQAAATPAVSSIAAPQPLASEDDTAEAGAVGGDIIALAVPEVADRPGAEAPSDPEATISAPVAVQVPDTPAPDTPASAPSPDAPRFDLVRVDADGTAVLAGRAVPGALISVLLGGKAVTTARAGDDGKFAALFLVSPSVAPQQVALTAEGADGSVLRGAETLIIAPSPELPPSPDVSGGADAAQTNAEPDVPTARAPAAQPRLLLADPEGMRVVQPGTGRPAVQTAVSIDAIAYDVEGTVVLSGRGSGTVRIYLDNRPVETVPVAADGQWRTPLPVVDTGVYQLRVDELDASGAVTSRTVTPFQREDAARIVALAEEQQVTSTGPRLITVQPGSTLWGIAREEYGRGVLFVRVFEANRGEIADPHWIYPGQIFSVPEGDE